MSVIILAGDACVLFKISIQIDSFHVHVPGHELARAEQAVKEVAEQAAHLNGERKMRPWPAESEGMSVSEKLVSCELLARPLRS